MVGSLSLLKCSIHLNTALVLPKTETFQSGSYWDTEQLLFLTLHPSLLILRSVSTVPDFKAESCEEELGGFKNCIWHIQEITEISNKLVCQSRISYFWVLKRELQKLGSRVRVLSLELFRFLWKQVHICEDRMWVGLWPRVDSVVQLSEVAGTFWRRIRRLDWL